MLKHLDRLDSLRLGRRPVYEPLETAAVSQALRPGDVFVDIGAHIGYYTVLAAALVGEHGKVFAFEPLEENAAVLDLNVQEAGYQNVRIERKAVSDRAGRATLRLSPENTGDNRLYEMAGWAGAEVETTSLDEYFAAYAGRLDFLKCDVQGFEWRVIDGGLEMLKKYRPAMLIEYYPPGIAASGGNERRFIGALLGLGYMISIADPQAGVVPYSRRLLEGRANRINGRHRNLLLRRAA